jgi:hypothetical protein
MKATLRFPLTPGKMAVMKNISNNNAGGDAGWG